MGRSESRHGQRDELKYSGDSAMMDRWEEGVDEEDFEQNEVKLSKHSSKDKDRRRSSYDYNEDINKDHRSRDRERYKKTDDAISKNMDNGREKHDDNERGRDKSRHNKEMDVNHDYDRPRNREREYDRHKDKRDNGKEWEEREIVMDKRREKENKDKDREREKEGGREREKEGGREREKEGGREREKEGGREREKEGGREREKEGGRERDKEGGREKEKDREKEKEKHRDLEERENDNGRDKEKGREKSKGRERDRHWEMDGDRDKDRWRERERLSNRRHEEYYEKSKDHDYNKRERSDLKQGKTNYLEEHQQGDGGTLHEAIIPAVELEERIMKMKEERSKEKSIADFEVLAWVNRSRKLEVKKNAEKEKAMQLSKIFEEQDNFSHGISEDEEDSQQITNYLAGVKVLHGLDKVIQGGAVTLTLKDQNILADGDINEEIDMLENVEIGEQKRRDEAYLAAKKNSGIFDNKFNEDFPLEKKILSQYDNPVTEEGIALDERGYFTGDAEKKLEELRKRLQGPSEHSRYEDLNVSGKIISDFYSQEEMLQFKKPKKKKSLRRRNKFDIDALEAEAISSGLGVGDLGSRNEGRMQAIREEKEKSDAKMRNSAYQVAYAKANEASKLLQLEQALNHNLEDGGSAVYADDALELSESLERARKLALKNVEVEASGPLALAHLATTIPNNLPDGQLGGDFHEGKIVFTEMEEFVSGLQLNDESNKRESEDVFMDGDDAMRSKDQENEVEPTGWGEVQAIDKDGKPAANNNDDENLVPDESIHEASVGKGLSGALKLLRERGTLKGSIDLGGRNMDKKKSKLIGITDSSNGRFKDIRIDRTDEFGRIMTPKEAFRKISHRFHGKGPGKMKQEKRMKQYYEELKLKQMKNSDTPTFSVERMKEAQAQLKAPYLVLSGHVKPGQPSDPASAFATVDQDLPGGLTPMLGDKKVEHFLGIKRISDYAYPHSKRPKT